MQVQKLESKFCETPPSFPTAIWLQGLTSLMVTHPLYWSDILSIGHTSSLSLVTCPLSLGHTSTLLARHPLYWSHFLSLSCHMSSLSWSHIHFIGQTSSLLVTLTLSLLSHVLSLLVTRPLYRFHFLSLSWLLILSIGLTSSFLVTRPPSW